MFDKDLTVPIAGYEAELTFKSSQPIFKKAYQVPYNIKDKFLVHLDTLEKQEIITPIQASEWASPVIAVVKKDGEIRMILVGKHTTNAHRHQLKVAYESNRGKVRVQCPMEQHSGTSKRRRTSLDDEEDFEGFSNSQDESGRPRKKKIRAPERSPIVTRSKDAHRS